MSEPQITPEAATAETEKPQSLADVVHLLVWEAENELWSPGELAEWRRLDPENPAGGAFWRAIVGPIERTGQLRGEDDDAEMRWALILRAIAELYAQHQRNRRLGQALAAAEVSEMRVTRLLRSDVEHLATTLRPLTHQLASAGEPVDLADIAWLVMTTRRGAIARKSEQTIRRQIARDYYRGLRKATESPQSA